MARKSEPLGVAFVAERAALLAALSTVLKVIDARAPVAVGTHVLIKADAGGVTLRGTDGVLEATASLQAEITVAGGITAPAHQLHDLVRSFPERATIGVELIDGKRLAVRAGKSRFLLPTFGADEMPGLDLSGEGESARFEISGQAFSDAIGQVAFAMSTEETRYYLNGIYLHAFPTAGTSHLRLVATDGHRLALVDLGAIPGVDASMPAVILGRKPVEVIRKVAEAAGDNPLGLIVTRNAIRVEHGDVVIVSKLIDGSYPDYEHVIPRSNPRKATTATADLAAVCERVGLLSSGSERQKGRSIALAFSEAGLLVSTSNSDGGEAHDEVDVEFSGEPLTIRFSPKKLAEILKITGADTVTIALDDPGAPALFRHGDSPVIHVLMPMRG